jgi:hypothetical protein
MSDVAFSLSALVGPEAAAAVMASAFFFAFGFLVYGGTRLALWAGMSGYAAIQRAKRAGLRHEPGKPAAGGADRV